MILLENRIFMITNLLVSVPYWASLFYIPVILYEPYFWPTVPFWWCWLPGSRFFFFYRRDLLLGLLLFIFSLIFFHFFRSLHLLLKCVSTGGFSFFIYIYLFFCICCVCFSVHFERLLFSLAKTRRSWTGREEEELSCSWPSTKLWLQLCRKSKMHFNVSSFLVFGCFYLAKANWKASQVHCKK